MDEDGATLSVGFAIDTAGSYDELVRLQAAMGSAEAQIVREAANVERATGNMFNVGGNVVQFTTATADATREMASARRERNAAEKAAERMTFALEREASTFGKTKAEIRQMRLEMKALAAEDAGLTDQAAKLRAAGAEMDRLEATAQAESRAIRDAAAAHEMFENAARKGMQALRERESVAASAGNYAAKLEAEAAAIGRTSVELKQMEAAQRAANAAAAGMPDQAARILAAGQAYGEAQRQATALAEATRKEAEMAREAAAAQAAYAAQANVLRAQLDPMFSAQQRFNQAMDQADALLEANIITLREHTAAQQMARQTLQDHAQAVAGSAAAMADLDDGLVRGTKNIGATRAAMQGLSFQAQDAFTQISMGTNVLQVLAIQGGQAAGQMAGLEGKLGKVAGFMIGPWGLAVTGALLVLGSLTEGLFDNGEAAKEAEEAMRTFQARQSDIGNFIDATTGRLTEQNRVLILNAQLTRQAQIQENNKTITQARNDAFEAARSAAFRATRAAPGSSLTGLGFGNNTGVQRAIRDANGDVGKLADSLARLGASGDQSAARAARAVAEIGGQSVLAARENERLQTELRALSGDTTALARSTDTAVTATTALGRSTGGAAASARTHTVAISEQEQALARANAEAQRFISSLEDEVLKMGLSAGELRQLEVARAMDAAATEEQRKRINELNAAREEAITKEERNLAAQKAKQADEEMAGRLGTLRDELALLGLVGAQRDIAALALEREGFFARATADGVTDVNAAWEEYLRLRTDIINGQSALAKEAEHARRLDDQLNDIVGTLGRMGGAGETLAGIMQGIGTGSFAGLGSFGVLFDLLRNNDGADMADEIGDRLTEVFGISGPFARTLGKTIQGAGIGMMAGSMVGGSSTANQLGSGVGGILGGIAGEAFKGGITNLASGAFGATIGKAIGTAVPVIGNILGGIAGNLIGGLFSGGSKYGGVSLSGSGAKGFGNNGEREGAAGTLGNSVLSGLQQIANQLGATVGNFSTTIGVYKDEFRVNTTGANKVGGYSGSAAENERKGLYNFGQDEAAAVAFALADAIKDGAIQGLSAASQALLAKGGDLEAQLNKVLQFEGVFSELERMKNPAEAATKQLEAEFAQLKLVFQEAGASAAQYAQLEELRGLKLAELAQQGAGVDDITNRRRELEIELMTAQGNIMGALAAARAQELAELDPSLRALQQQIWAAQLLNDQRQLEIQLMEAQGNTAGALSARREIELAATDESLRALKTQVWAMQDAQETSRAAMELRDAWSSVGDSIMDEVKRIRGLTGGGDNNFASLLGQFNAANAAARGGDIEAARNLPGLSQELLRVAGEMATSRQELDRVQAQVAAMLEQTNSLVSGGVAAPANSVSDAALVAAAGQAQAGATKTAANDDLIAEVRALNAKVEQLRTENTAGHAATAANTGKTARHLDNVTGETGGNAIAVRLSA